MSETDIPRLFLSHIAERDRLSALEFGRVDDGQPPENWVGVEERFGYLYDRQGGRALGFVIKEFSQVVLEEPQLAPIWDGPLFDAPVVCLRAASAGEIATAARRFFAGGSSINRYYFDSAADRSVDRTGGERAALWLACLQSGDGMAHFGLGCELYQLGRYREAYRHLRHYAELAPHSSWNQCWLGKAAIAIGEPDEARAALRRAIGLTEDGDAETDAPDLLQALVEKSRGAAGGWVRDEASALRIAERTQKYSTAAKHGREPAARLLSGDEYRSDELLVCPNCGWSGTAAQADRDVHDSLFDVSCPACEKMLVIVDSSVAGEPSE